MIGTLVKVNKEGYKNWSPLKEVARKHPNFTGTVVVESNLQNGRYLIQFNVIDGELHKGIRADGSYFSDNKDCYWLWSSEFDIIPATNMSLEEML